MREREINRRKMTALVARWVKSGATLSAFARSHGITRDKLQYWVRRLKARKGAGRSGRRRVARKAAVSFSPVHVVAAPVGAALEVVLPDGVRVSVDRGAAPDLAVVVIEALRRAC
jgi:transposase-like protein